jgi:hypothetical protein
MDRGHAAVVVCHGRVAAQRSRSALRGREAASRCTRLVNVTATFGIRTVAIQGTTLLGNELPAVFLGQAAGAYGAVRLVAAIRRDFGENS